MPYLASLAQRGAVASQYFANLHPSIGNYFMLTTGVAAPANSDFNGVVTDDNVARELVAAGKSWKAYAESIPSAGYLGGDVPPYLRRHVPLTFLSDVADSASQAANIVPLTQLAADMSSGGLPNYMFLVPNAINSGHNCEPSVLMCTTQMELAASDSWLQSTIGPLLENSEFKSSGLLAVVWDESEDDNELGGGRVYLLLLGPNIKPGFVSSMLYQHQSLLRLSMTVLGVSQIPGAGASAAAMDEFFQ
jgi:acid phosphatase